MWLYNIAIILYSLAIKLASLWIPKAKLWCEGRRDIFERIAKTVAPTDRILWIHVASLGEFEQGRPLIEKIRQEQPQYKILLTFYSPSGYELRKNYEGADYIFYLPLDTPRGARKFLEVAHPEVAIIVKYEFWLNLLYKIKRQGIKCYIVSAIFRQDSIFFKWYGSMWRLALKSFNQIFVQNQESKELLKGIGVENVIVAGDTRFDRVAQIAKSAPKNPLVENFKGSTPLFIAGSTWPADEDLLIEVIKANPQIKFVIAPHEIDAPRVGALSERIPSSIRYTQASQESNIEGYQTLILDTMGQLSSIYQYARWAYIGGGFGVGIHNTLEASTFGLPIAFGTNYHKFKEARDMVELGGCCSVSNADELIAWFTPLRDDEPRREQLSQINKQYTAQKQGASKIITDAIFQ